MDVRIKPAILRGNVNLPPSKSLLHRFMLAAALTGGNSQILNYVASDDIEATLGGIRALGAVCELKKDILSITGIKETPEHVSIYCGESGSTLRFLVPVALALTRSAEFTGETRLFERPLEPYFDIFRENGIKFVKEKNSLKLEGELKPGKYSLRGDISSQFITGLLFALTLLDGDSEIRVDGPLESRGYVDMTLMAFSRFCLNTVSEEAGIFRVKGGGRYRPCMLMVETDFSQAAFFLVANELGCNIAMRLPMRSVQGDSRIFSMIKTGSDTVVNASQIPDLVPPISVIAALRENSRTVIKNAARLRIKESDRLEALRSVLGAMGADIVIDDDKLIITGVSALKGAEIDSHNDHRIAMAAAVAAIRADGEVIIRRAECVKKSYPGFWEDYRGLGGNICFV